MARLEPLTVCLLVSLLSLVRADGFDGSKPAQQQQTTKKSKTAKSDPKYTVTEEVYFDIKIKDYDGDGEDYTGRFVVALFGETCPISVMNFQSLAKGYRKGGQLLHYKDTPIHRVVQDFVIQMGDVTKKDGSGGESIYGRYFADENFEISHSHVGMVAMANHGKDTNGSQFFVILNKSRWLDRKHVAFGKVTSGMDVIRKVADIAVNPNTSVPVNAVMITDCGVVGIKNSYVMSAELLEAEDEKFQ